MTWFYYTMTALTQIRHRGRLKDGISQRKKTFGGSFCGFWLGYKDSNLGVPESESGALPLGHTPIERATRA